MSESQNTYDDGLRDGRIETLEKVTKGHTERLDSHSRRLRMMERIVWAIGGIFVFIQFLPDIKTFAGLWAG